MNYNRIGLLWVAFLALASGLVLSRAWSAGGTSPSRQKNEVAAAGRGGTTKQVGEPDTLIAAAGPVALGEDQIRVSLKASQAGESLGAKLSSMAANRRVFLIIGDMSAADQPGVPYQIFFDLPRGAKADVNSPQYVGIITFFNAVKLEGTDPNSKDDRFFSFDITDTVRKLRSRKLLSEDPSVTIKPGGTPSANARARIDRIEVFLH